MKKCLVLGAILLSGSLALAGCGGNGGKDDPNAYGKLNELAQKDYSSVTMSVSTTLHGETLSGTYVSKATASGYSVEFSYEKIGVFDITDGEDISLPGYKTTCSGKMTIVNGAVTAQEGDEPEYTFGQLTSRGMDFSEYNFTEASAKSNKLTANVADILGFFGRPLPGAKNMSVEANYSKNAITSLVIRYEMNGSQVELNYSFEL